MGYADARDTGIPGYWCQRFNPGRKQPIATVVAGAESWTNTKRRHERDYSFFPLVAIDGNRYPQLVLCDSHFRAGP